MEAICEWEEVGFTSLLLWAILRQLHEENYMQNMC